jgi:hypothetical protein
LEVNGNTWAFSAKSSIVGFIDLASKSSETATFEDLSAFPIPTSGFITVPVPDGRKFNYCILASTGQLIKRGIIENPQASVQFDFSEYIPGVYVLILTDDNGRAFRIKVIKE